MCSKNVLQSRIIHKDSDIVTVFLVNDALRYLSQQCYLGIKEEKKGNFFLSGAMNGNSTRKILLLKGGKFTELKTVLSPHKSWKKFKNSLQFVEQPILIIEKKGKVLRTQ